MGIPTGENTNQYPNNNIVKRDYTDSTGIKRRVLLPNGITNLSEGIPISLDVDSLYPKTPLEYRQRLTDELWARGLIEPCDYLKPGAGELIRSSILAAVKKDLLDVITYASEVCKK